MKTRITVISDTHTRHGLIPLTDLPGGDILIHAGDIMNSGYNKNDIWDFCHWFQSLKQYENNIAPAMAKLLCIFLRKKKENGSLETFKNSFMEREILFEEVIISDVNDLFLFFLDGENLSQNNMKDYLENQKSNQESEIDFQS